MEAHTAASFSQKLTRVPEPQKYVEYWLLGLYLGVLGYYFTYFWGPGSTLRVQGPKYRASEPKYYNINGIWALKTYYLGPWTLRGS